MKFPLELRFKVAAISSQIYVKDAAGIEQFYVKQKLFKLKENIEIFRDSNMSEPLGAIKADKVLDYSPTYTFYDRNDQVLGSIKRNGTRSLWSASYTLTMANIPPLNIREANPWVKVADGILGEIPILGLFMGYMLHPKYLVESGNKQLMAELEKKPAFLEGLFTLTPTRNFNVDEKHHFVFSALIMMVALMERQRG
jgi:hypothetical protein